MTSRVGTFQLSSLTTLPANNIKFCRENYNCNSFEIWANGIMIYSLSSGMIKKKKNKQQKLSDIHPFF